MAKLLNCSYIRNAYQQQVTHSERFNNTTI